MRLHKVTAWSQLKTGDRVICFIDGTQITDCKVLVESSITWGTNVFLCQNLKVGNRGSSTLGYTNSWELTSPVYSGLDENLRYRMITGLRVLAKEET